MIQDKILQNITKYLGIENPTIVHILWQFLDHCNAIALTICQILQLLSLHLDLTSSSYLKSDGAFTKL